MNHTLSTEIISGRPCGRRLVGGNFGDFYSKLVLINTVSLPHGDSSSFGIVAVTLVQPSCW
jgi:hypothetical protein